MKINTKIGLKDLAGKVIQDSETKEIFTLGGALANILVGAEEGGKMKLYVLATKLFQQNNVDVDESDLSLIKSAVKSTKVYGALIAGQCEILLDEVKEDKKEEKKGK